MLASCISVNLAPIAMIGATIRLNEWNECRVRGWEGDVPPVAGLSSREETVRLLAQVSSA